MGIGMPFMFVTLTTLPLSTIPRTDMTGASSLYTLARRIGGNIGYALVATLVARIQQIHRVQMVSHITPPAIPTSLIFYGAPPNFPAMPA
jgi:MFS transporter, DHA2 family, multidrug resistance protein